VAVGAQESSEFQRQAALIRAQWGPTSVPVCETLPAVNHYTILHGLATAEGRLHALTARLLGLPQAAAAVRGP
jgi:arylformamidase